MLLFYPCRNGTLINFVGYFSDSEDPAKGSGTIPQRLKDLLIVSPQAGRGLHREKKSSPNSRSSTPGFCVFARSGRTTYLGSRAHRLLGDAAHGTLPFLGMGASMAMEEAASIGCLFPAGTRPADIPARLAAYQDIRKTS